MKIAVIGTGYVGLVEGACLAHLGHEVWCVDVDEAKINKLKAGEIPFHEKGLAELVSAGVTSSKLKFTTDYQDLTARGLPQAIFICVQTPYAQDGSCDLTYVEQVCESLREVIDSSVLIVIKSTLPPGTNRKIKQWLAIDDVEIASNPEFLREGLAVEDFFHPERILLGVESERAEKILRELHQGIDAPIFVVSPETAQLAKYANNTFLASRLGLINEIANIADLVGADIKDVEQIIGSDSRIGPKFLRAGAGFGGSCFPKDVLALENVARAHGYTPRLIQPIIEMNRDQPYRFVELVRKVLGGVEERCLAVWGLAFNRDTDDTRESPAIRIVKALLDEGAQLQVFDPAAMKVAQRDLGDRVEYMESAMDAVLGSEVLLVLTEWGEFAKVDWLKVKDHLASAIIFDGKNFLPHQTLRDHGFQVHGIGLCQPPASDLQ